MHEKRIEIRWRDMDAYRHVYHAAYLTYAEEVRDEYLARVLGHEDSFSDFVLVRVAVDFRQELQQDDDAVVAVCCLTRIGGSSLSTREEIRKLDGSLSAEVEAVLVARDLERGSSRPLTAEERAALEHELAGATPP